MSRFKPGDRIQLMEKYQLQIRSMTKVIGTVRDIIDGIAYVVLDNKLMTYNEDGDKIYFQEGNLDKQLESLFEVIEESDWSSMWDDAATSTESPKKSSEEH